MNLFQYDENDVSSSNDDYSLREYYDRKTSPVVWKLDEYVPATSKRSIDDFESVEYYSKIKKPFVKIEEVECFSDASENEEKILIKEFDIEEIPFEYEDNGPGIAYQILNPSDSNFVLYEERRPKSSHSCEDELELEESSSNSQAEVETKPNFKVDSVVNRALKRSLSSSDDEDNLKPNIIYADESESSSPEILNEVRIIPSTFKNQRRISVKRNLFVKDHASSSSERSFPRKQSRSGLVVNRRASDSPERETIGIKKWRENSLAKRSSRNLGETSLSRIVGNHSTQPDSPETTSYHDARRVTRSCVRGIECSSLSGNGRFQIGKFVWGYCMGWWPGETNFKCV